MNANPLFVALRLRDPYNEIELLETFPLINNFSFSEKMKLITQKCTPKLQFHNFIIHVPKIMDRLCVGSKGWLL